LNGIPDGTWGDVICRITHICVSPHSVWYNSGLNTAHGAYVIVIQSYVRVAPSQHAVRMVSQTWQEGIDTETEIF